MHFSCVYATLAVICLKNCETFTGALRTAERWWLRA